MKKFFTYSLGDSLNLVNENYEIAKSVFDDIEKIEGSSTIIETYRDLSIRSEKNQFIWIDADNIVKPDAIKILEHHEPCILMTINEYRIQYGHGGIKKCKPFVFIRDNAIDVSYYLGLTAVNVVGSFHCLGEGWLKYRAIFSEMVKNALRNDQQILDKWKECRPDIWENVTALLTSSDINTVLDIIRHRQSFKRYYENNLCSNL
jgi:hypothetical protein